MQRRPFLASLGATAAAVTTGARAQEEGGKKLGWALVGLGSLSTNQIAPALAKTKHCKLSAVVTGTPAKAEQWKAKHGLADSHVYNYETFDKIAENPDVDVIYIVLPNSMHEEFVEPSKRYADLIIPEGGENLVAIDAIISRVERLVS